MQSGAASLGSSPEKAALCTQVQAVPAHRQAVALDKEAAENTAKYNRAAVCCTSWFASTYSILLCQVDCVLVGMTKGLGGE